MYDFIDLKLIQFIAEERNLSAVATRAKMSLPAVSQRLGKLEAALKVKLVIRAGRFGLTPEGRQMLHSANAMLAEAESLEARLKRICGSRGELLRIACTDPILLSHLPPVLKKLNEQHPELRLHIEEVGGQLAHRLLANGEVDVALMPMGTPHSQFHVVSYRTEKVCLLAPLVHPLGQEVRPVPAAAISRFDFIGLSDGVTLIDHLCRQHGIALRYKTTVSSTEAQCLLLAQSTTTLALTFESSARRHARTQPITVIRIKDEWANVTFVAKTLRGTVPPPTLSLLVELLTESHA